MVIAQCDFGPQRNLKGQPRDVGAVDLLERTCRSGLDLRFLQHFGVDIIHQQIHGLLIDSRIAIITKDDLVRGFTRTKPRDLAALCELPRRFPPRAFKALRLNVDDDLRLMIFQYGFFEFQRHLHSANLRLPESHGLLGHTWGRWDLNPHALRHMILSHACLPIPARPLSGMRRNYKARHRQRQ